MVVVGNNLDLEVNRQVATEEATSYAERCALAHRMQGIRRADQVKQCDAMQCGGVSVAGLWLEDVLLSCA